MLDARGLSWWRGIPTYSCGLLQIAGSESMMTVVGIGGLLIAKLGVMFGGVRHWLTGFGVAVMVVGLLGITLAGGARRPPLRPARLTSFVG